MPKPHPLGIIVTPRQREILESLVRASKTPQRELQRAQIILQTLEKPTNRAISKHLGIKSDTVSKWRKRWHNANLHQAEHNLDDKKLKATIRDVLSDKYRSGTPPKFSAEQITQILALACENPNDSGYPVSHWTLPLLKSEAIKRGFVESISQSSLCDFLKRSPIETA